MNRLIGGWRDGEMVNVNTDTYRVTKPNYLSWDQHDVAVRTTPMMYDDKAQYEYVLRKIIVEIEGVQLSIQAYFSAGIPIQNLVNEYMTTHEKLKAGAIQ